MKASSSWSNYTPQQACGICMENKSVSDYMIINGCFHSYCSKCIGRYVSEKIINNVAAIACPHPGCKVGTLTPEMCRRETIVKGEPVIEPGLFDHWNNVLMKNKFSCPFRECSGLVYTTVNSQGMCYGCSRHFCRICKSIWHPNLACKDVQQLRQDDWKKEDLLFVELANKQGWKRCPFCSFYVEKVSGCPNIMCRCGQSFKYI